MYNCNILVNQIFNLFYFWNESTQTFYVSNKFDDVLKYITTYKNYSINWNDWKQLKKRCLQLDEKYMEVHKLFESTQESINLYTIKQIDCYQIVHIVDQSFYKLMSYLNQIQIMSKNFDQYVQMLQQQVRLINTSVVSEQNLPSHEFYKYHFEPTIEQIKLSTQWLDDICYIYSKYDGSIPTTPINMMKFFKRRVHLLSDQDLHNLTLCIEHHLGNTTLEFITTNLQRFLTFNWNDLSKEVQCTFIR